MGALAVAGEEEGYKETTVVDRESSIFDRLELRGTTRG
jgi:hypothetical protein